LYLNVQGAIAGRPPSHTERYWILTILILPYLIYITVLLEAFGIALSDKSQTFTSISYCSLNNNIPGRITTAIFIILVIPCLILLFLIWKSLRKNSTNLQHARQYRMMFIRIASFLGLGVIAICTGISFFFLVFTDNHGLALARLNIVLASIALIGVIIFSSQRDLMEFWLFWRWFKKPTYYDSDHHLHQQRPRAQESFTPTTIVRTATDESTASGSRQFGEKAKEYSRSDLESGTRAGVKPPSFVLDITMERENKV